MTSNIKDQIGSVGPWVPGEGQMMITKKVPLLVYDMFHSQKNIADG